MSTSTEPGCICVTSSLLTSFGAFAPGTSTAPITMSAARTSASTASLFDASVLSLPPNWASSWRSRSTLRVEHGHVRAHAQRDGGGVHARHAAADHDDLRRRHARHATGQHAAATGGLHQRVRADLRREPARDLGHRREQRQRAVRGLHGLVRDRGGARVEQRLGQRLVGGQVQVGEEHLAGTQPRVLGTAIGSLTLSTRSPSPHTSSAVASTWRPRPGTPRR